MLRVKPNDFQSTKENCLGHQLCPKTRLDAALLPQVSQHWFCKLCNGCLCSSCGQTQMEQLISQAACLCAHVQNAWFVENSVPVRFFTDCMRIEARARRLPITFSTREFPCRYAGRCNRKLMLNRVETTYLRSCRIVGSLSHL